MARLSHEKLLELLEGFGYDVNKLGMCTGISPMGLIAILSEEVEVFDARIHYLADQLQKVSVSNLVSKINFVQEKRAQAVESYKKDLLSNLKLDQQMPNKDFYQLLKNKKFKKNTHVIEYHQKCANTDNILNPDEKALSDVQAFLDGIVISFFCSKLYPDLYKKEQQVAYNDLDISLKWILSHKLVEKPNPRFKYLAKLFKIKLKEKSLVKKAGRIIGIYNQNELQQLFEELKILSNRYGYRIGYHLGSIDHQISAGFIYTDQRQCWNLIDANKLPSRKRATESGLTSEVFSSFQVKNRLVLDTEIYCMKGNYKALKKDLTDLAKTPVWKKLHALDGKQLVVDDLGNTILKTAARAGDVDLLKKLLECKDSPVDLNKADAGSTALCYAVMYGRYDAVNFLLKNKFQLANPNLMHTKAELSPVALAVQNGDEKMVKRFLKFKNQIDLELAGRFGYTPLHIAAKSGNVDLINLLLAAGANRNKQNIAGDTPLDTAINEGHLTAVEALLASGVDLTLMAIDQNTPFLRAIQSKNLAMVKAILNSSYHHIDVNRKNIYEISPIIKAILVGDIVILKELLAHQSMQSGNVNTLELLAVAIKAGNLEMVQALLLHCKNLRNEINDTVQLGYTPLYYAVIKNNHAIVKLLLDELPHEIDPYLNIENYSALDMAAYDKKVIVFDTIINHPTFMLKPTAALACIKEAMVTTATHGGVEILRLALASDLISKNPTAVAYAQSMRKLAKDNSQIEIVEELTNFIRLHQKQIQCNYHPDNENHLVRESNKRSRVIPSDERSLKRSNMSPLTNNSFLAKLSSTPKPTRRLVESANVPHAPRKKQCNNV